MIFIDRCEAGRLLVEELRGYVRKPGGMIAMNLPLIANLGIADEEVLSLLRRSQNRELLAA